MLVPSPALRYSAGTMRIKHFTWLGRRFIDLSAQGQPGVPVDATITEMFENFALELTSAGLSLDNTVRVRIWGRDQEARSLATVARSKILAGDRKAASSSFISQQWFDSKGTAGLELLALHPRNSAAVRSPVDFVPARNYLCFLEYDSLLFFSGFTSEALNMAQQTAETLATLESALSRAGAHWPDVRKVSLMLQRGVDAGPFKQVLERRGAVAAELELSFVDGFAGEKYLLEIEATAVRD